MWREHRSPVASRRGGANSMSEAADDVVRKIPSARPSGASIQDAEARNAPHKLGLRSALTALVLGTVTLTALLIHLFWSYTAHLNVADVVGQLNRQIVGS